MDEYINREDALKIIDSYSKACTEEGKIVADAIRDIIAVITPTADLVPKSEVAREVAYDFQNRLRHIFLDMCNYNDYETLNLLQIDSAIEALYDTFFSELKKKYTEGE